MKPSELFKMQLDRYALTSASTFDTKLIIDALDAHHASTQAQIAALEKRVGEIEKANEELGRRTAGLKVIGEQGPYREQIIDVRKLTSEE